MYLQSLGFDVRHYRFGEGMSAVDNLYARWGTQSPNFCFAGHVDVVPAGPESAWCVPPFAAQVQAGKLYGRGAADMKGAIAAYLSAVSELLTQGWQPNGSLSFLLTSDEEGAAINGTKKLLAAIYEEGEIIDHCLVGEPTNPDYLGQMIKHGRRGSMNVELKVRGRRGHVAYPDKALNPAPVLLELLQEFHTRVLDLGADGFLPSNLEISAIEMPNPAENVIPEEAVGRFNIRFNICHTGAELQTWVETVVADARARFGGEIELSVRVSGESFVTPPGRLTDILQAAIADVTQKQAVLSTSGGTSDARFINVYAPVAEFGLVNATIHQVDEHVRVQDLYDLRDIYKVVLQRYFTS